MITTAPPVQPDLRDFENPAAEQFWNQLGFEPTPIQREVLKCRKREIMVAGGIQAGKSITAEKYLVQMIGEIPAGGRFGLVAADYNRTEREFGYLASDLIQLRLTTPQDCSKRVDPGLIKLVDGTKIVTLSGKDPRTIAMYAYDGIVICEASQVELETYWKCQERVAPKRGWLLLVGTFEGSVGWYPSLFTSWRMGYGDTKSFSMPTWSNTHLFPGGINDPEIQRLREKWSADYFAERFGAEPRPPHGLVFSEFSVEYHVQDVQYDPHYPVQIAVDPGYNAYHAVLAIQKVKGQFRIIDEIYQKGLTTEAMIDACEKRPWATPWGERTIGGAIDVYGYRHQAMAAPAEIWLARTGMALRAEVVRVADGTERLKSLLKIDPLNKVPQIVVSPKAKGLLSEFGVAPNPDDGQVRAYRWKTDRDGNIIGHEPEDENNHAIKALIYWAVSELGYVASAKLQLAHVTRW